MKNKDKPAAITLTLVVWGLAGALFGSLFAALHAFLILLGLSGWQPILVGTLIAAITTTALYSAMPVALVGAMGGVLASIGTLMASGDQIQLPLIVGIAVCAGAVAGVFYGWVNQGGGRPLAETLTGLLSGLLAGALVALGLSLYGEPVAMFGLAAGIVALVGGFFQLSERRVVGLLTRWCPRIVSAPLVAGLVAAVVGAGIWVMAGTPVGLSGGATGTVIGQVVQQVPSGLLGGMLGGAATGILLEISGAHLEDHDQAL